MIPVEFKIRVAKQLALDFPGAVPALKRLSRIAQRLLKHRIDELGQLADGSMLPLVADRYAILAARDADALDPLKSGGASTAAELAGAAGALAASLQKGAAPPGGAAAGKAKKPKRRRIPSYLALKRRRSGKVRVGQSLTGSMWASLRASARPLGSGSRGRDWEIKLFFGGSDPRTGVRQRAKARLLQYSTRGAAEFRERDGAGRATAASAPEFFLMELSVAELRILRREWMRELRAFKPGTWESR